MPGAFKNPNKSRRMQQFFAKQPSNAQPRSLSQRKLSELQCYYQDKYNIRIIINGQSKHMPAIQQQEWQSFIDQFITDYDTTYVKFPLATYVRHNYNLVQRDPRYNRKHTQLLEKYVIQVAKSFRNTRINRLAYKKNISEAEWVALEYQLNRHLPNTIKKKILQNSPTDDSNPLSEDYLQGIANSSHQQLSANITKQQALKEIWHIQMHLKQGEQVGYIFTNQGNHTSHCEVVIINRQHIIKPIVWSTIKLDRLDSDHFATPLAFHIDELHVAKQTICPQATPCGCSTLGIMYLKELLKDSSRQLTEYTLCFSYIAVTGYMRQFFLPSPQTLKYSQSSFYNGVLKHMLISDEDDIVIENAQGRHYVTPSITGMLKQSLSSSDLSPEQIAHNDNLLTNLESFRQHWLQAYKQYCSIKRPLYQSAKDGTNGYLLFKSHKLARIQATRAKSKHSPSAPTM